jgi:enamine deaminase RidA (YjgF/YER057c/UK114 family)
VPRFKLHTPGGWGENKAAGEHYSQVMEIDGRVELSGQGGWHPETLDFPARVSLETEIQQAFENVAFMLKVCRAWLVKRGSSKFVSRART